jgi:SAM-dependent methyltransferase
MRQLAARSLLDAGCGDFQWMRWLVLPGVKYIGIDVVPDVIRNNQQMYASDNRSFLVADITSDRLPTVDVVLCRHCLIHLSNRQVLAALQNFRRSRIKYLLATTFRKIEENTDTWPGSFRPINLEAPPFNLPEPLFEIGDSAGDEDASLSVLAVWRLSQ